MNSQREKIIELEKYLNAGYSCESASTKIINILMQLDKRITDLEIKNERNESDGR